MKCPKCGHEFGGRLVRPLAPYRYKGQHAKYLPLILDMLQNQEPYEKIKQAVAAASEGEFPYYGPGPTIKYIALRYGFKYLVNTYLPKTETEKRNIEIARAYNDGKTTYRALSKTYNISYERVRQIICIQNRKKAALNGIRNIDDASIDSLGLSTRTRNCLFNLNLKTLAEIRQLTDEQLMRAPNFGKASLRELHKLLDNLNEGVTDADHDD